MFNFIKNLFKKKEKQVVKIDIIQEALDNKNRNPGYIPRPDIIDLLCDCNDIECGEEEE